MKFIPYQSQGDPSSEVILGVIAVALIGLSLLILIARAFLFGGGKGYMKTAIIVAPFLIAGIVGLGILGGISVTRAAESVNARTDKVIAEISSTYHIDLSREQTYDLRYPYELPDTRFETYGSTKANLPTEKGFQEREVYLVWTDGSLALAKSPDGGKSFDVLKPVAE